MTLILATKAADPIELVCCGACGSAAAILDEAAELGFVFDEGNGEWACEACATAPETPVLVGMRVI